MTTAFALTHFRPARMTDHFELSIMIGTRAISGSVPIMIDSSKWSVILAGPKCVQGKAVVNSIS